MTIFTANGDYVGGSVSINDPTTSVSVVREELSNTRTRAEEVLVMLIGDEGDGGLLGDMVSGLAAAPSVSISPEFVDTSLDLISSGKSAPVFDTSTLKDYPDETYEAPEMSVLPSINTDFSDVPIPDDISLSMEWAESTLPSEMFNAIKAKIIVELESDPTGLSLEVEEAIYQRAKARQQVDRLDEWDRINNSSSELQFAYPSGVLLSGLAGYSNGANRQDADIENGIIISRGELAQKNVELAQQNRQHTLEQAMTLETLLRQTRNEESNRSLDKVKSFADNAIKEFSARIQKFIGIWEGRKTTVQAQAEALRGVIESNKALIDIYAKKNDALETRVNATTSYNKGMTDVFSALVQGFGESERSISNQNDVAVKLLAEKIKNSELDLRAKISQAETLIQAYSSEQSVRERISTGVANIASQVSSSLLSAVHTSLGANYSASESADKSYRVSVGLSENHSIDHEAI